MNITDELRKWWVRKFPVMDKELHKDFTAIADRIDAEHEKAMSRAGQLLADAEKDRDYNYANWQDCKQKVLQHNITLDELSAEIERLEDELAHCIELTKDADGEPIRVGDVMRLGSVKRDLTVLGFGVPDVGGNDYGVFVYDCDEYTWYNACFLRHHHAPTVEDVLREMLDAWGELPSNATNEAIIAEYATKLRLAEGEDA